MTDHLWQEERYEAPDNLVTSSVVVQELYFGAFKSRRPVPNLNVFDSLQFPVIDFDRDDARQAGLIRADLARRGMPIGPYDGLIAGQALNRGLTLVTRNTREFGRVQGLQIEDWEEA